MKTLTGILALTAITVALSGCPTLFEAGRESEDPFVRAYSRAKLSEQEHKRRKEEAREGRSEVNVNVNVEGGRQEPQKVNLERYSLSFNKWEDNGDGMTELSEFKGVKDIFKQNERIELYFAYETIENVKGKKLIMRIFGPKEDLVLESSIVSPNSNWYIMRSKSIDRRITRFDSGKKPGRYIAEWYTEDNQLLGAHNFRIIE